MAVDETLVNRLIKDLDVGETVVVSDWDVVATDVPGERRLFIRHNTLENVGGLVKLTRVKKGFTAQTIAGMKFDVQDRFNPATTHEGVLYLVSTPDGSREYYYEITSVRIVNRETISSS